MPTEILAAHATRAMRRWWPEALLAVLAGVVFLGCLGSVDLWGKREQRASAEAIDTVDHQHWLVAQIQGRPRLEKPPLPRWSIAALMVLTGRRDEWIVRLPGAVSALATVALIYSWENGSAAVRWDWPRPWSSVPWDSTWARCARPATTGRSLCSPRWHCARPGAGSTSTMTTLRMSLPGDRSARGYPGTWSCMRRWGWGF